MQFMTILLNNTLVLLIYSLSGLLVKNLTASKLAPMVPWTIFIIHAFKITAGFFVASLDMGFVTCLALVLPHGILEIPALIGACYIGSRLVFEQSLRPVLAYCWLCILVAAVIETWLTPFPFHAWVAF